MFVRMRPVIKLRGETGRRGRVSRDTPWLGSPV
jgi:hypothetical protein